jgi:hypothetical protein
MSVAPHSISSSRPHARFNNTKRCPTCPNQVPKNFLPDQNCSVCLHLGDFRALLAVEDLEVLVAEEMETV